MVENHLGAIRLINWGVLARRVMMEREEMSFIQERETDSKPRIMLIVQPPLLKINV